VSLVLVTGAAGFIGGALADAAASAGHVVVRMDKAWGTSTAEPGLVERMVRDYRPDVIVHMGGYCSSQGSLRDPATDFTDNVVGTFRVAEAARQFGVAVIFNTTMKTTRGVDGRITPYGMSKHIGEMYLRMYWDLYEVPCVINRPSSVYGPGQHGTEDGGWVTHFTFSALRGEPVKLWAPLTNSRDVLYIDDHVRLLLDQIDNFARYARPAPYDVGGGPENELSIAQLLAWLAENGRPLATRPHPPVAGDVERVVNDNAEVSAVNGWRPRVHWTEGLQRTLGWARNVV
jgi:nucleoside-diphosphate-sugar epimerase